MNNQQLNLTHQEHLQWNLWPGPQITWAGPPRSFANRVGHDEAFSVRFGKAEDCKSWAEELRIAVQKLIADHGTKLALFYSGGSDSEVALRMLLEAGVKPEVHIIQFAENLNWHEIHHAFDLCASLGIEPVVWHHDAIRYIKSEGYMHLATKYQCSQIAYLKVLEYARRVDRPVIMGGEIYFQKHQLHDGGRVHADTAWYYIYREDEDGVTYRYSYDTGHPVINEFFTYTPNLLYSWMIHPSIKRIANNEEPGKITLLSIKGKVYQQELGIQLAAQKKFHGYEALTWVNRFVQQKMKALLPPMQTCKYEYNQLVNDLLCGTQLP